LPDSLHSADLALAQACMAGDEAAWERFVLEYRPALYRAAAAIDPTGGARDLADALYGELFGLHVRDGVRQSLFRYFQGRSSLATWLRAVLAQRYVDRLRATRRLDPLPEDSDVPAPAAAAPDADHRRLVEITRAALAAAVSRLDPRDRLRLGLYYAQDMTLAAIGRLCREHEATVSRQLARTRRAIREDVERQLRSEHHMDDRTIEECFDAMLDDPGSMDVAELTGAPSLGAGHPSYGEAGVPGKISALDRSKN
jgi:RNA polymerase sigma factor (sigma-70 family)